MTSSPAHVFISYSRKDFHFAESLARHLLKHDVPAWLDVKDLAPGVEWERDLIRALDESGVFLLVASPAAMGSPNVRREWERALSEGKRVIVLGWFRRAALPPELQTCESVDFRGGFAGALSRLLATMGAGASVLQATRRSGIGRMPRLPPSVLAMTLALAMPIVGYALTVYPDTRFDGEIFGLGRIGEGLMLAVFSLALVWALCLSLSQRRMGMTRLLVSLALVAAPYVFALGKLLLGGPAGLVYLDPGVAQNVVEHWRLGLVFLAFPLCGALVLVLARPEDLLRWMPTGKVWTLYRSDQARSAQFDVVDAERVFALVGSFRILHDACDAGMAARLRAELTRSGGAEATAGDDATAVLLITNRTSVEWLDRQAQQVPGRLLSVVGTAIALPESLAWLWKRQWVDFRRWSVRRPRRERGLANVPEAVQTLRPPAGVTNAHRLLCAFGALLFALGNAVQPEEPTRGETLSIADVVTGLAVCTGWLMAVPARGLLRRNMSQRAFARWVGRLVAAGMLFGTTAVFFAVFMVGGIWLRAIAGLLALGVLPWLGWRRRDQLAFWFPHIGATPSPAPARLTPAADWRTFGYFALFFVVWALLLNPGLI